MGMAAAESHFHVLAVDDSFVDRKFIEKLLKKSSYQVTAVDSGSKALEFLGLQEHDQIGPNTPSVSPNNHHEVEVNLIITDYCMPGMTGYDLLKKIKESSSLRNIPVVIMSSENVPSRISRCLEEGAEEFFLKPVKSSDVNRLKSHMMRTKMMNQKQEIIQENPHQDEQPPEESDPQLLQLQQQQQQPEERDSQLLQLQQEQQQQQQPEGTDSQLLQLQLQQQEQPEETDSQLEQLQQRQQQQQQLPNNGNKRKTIEEGLSPDRTRPRYNSIATEV